MVLLVVRCRIFFVFMFAGARLVPCYIGVWFCDFGSIGFASFSMKFMLLGRVGDS